MDTPIIRFCWLYKLLPAKEQQGKSLVALLMEGFFRGAFCTLFMHSDLESWNLEFETSDFKRRSPSVPNSSCMRVCPCLLRPNAVQFLSTLSCKSSWNSKMVQCSPYLHLPGKRCLWHTYEQPDVLSGNHSNKVLPQTWCSLTIIQPAAAAWCSLRGHTWWACCLMPAAKNTQGKKAPHYPQTVCPARWSPIQEQPGKNTVCQGGHQPKNNLEYGCSTSANLLELITADDAVTFYSTCANVARHNFDKNLGHELIFTDWK